MFKKSLVLASMLLSLNALAELPRRLTALRAQAIIRGDGLLTDGQKSCKLDRKFLEVHLPHYTETQTSQKEVLTLLATNPSMIEREDEYHTPETVTYLIGNESTPASTIYRITFKCE